MKYKVLKFTIIGAMCLMMGGCSKGSAVGSQSTQSTVSNAVITLGENTSVEGSGASVEGTTVTINKGGSYDISGNVENGAIIVDTEGEVTLNLSGANITSNGDSAIKVLNAEKVYINTVEGSENTIADSAEYTGDGKGAISSNDCLEIGGSGTLNITSNYKHGISSDDEIIVTGGVLNITAVTDGINANEEVTILGGEINVKAQSDGIESETLVVFEDGALNADVVGDGVKSQVDMTINGGSINITNADEGLESKSAMAINGGAINCYVSDDGINAGDELTINGGELYIVAERGDALDSNTGINVNGGVTVAIGGQNPEGGIDCDNNGIVVTGGTLIAGGGTNSSPSNESSTQASVGLSGVGEGELLALTSSTGEVFAFNAPKAINSVIFTSDKLVVGESYTVYTGGEVTEGTEFNGLYTDCEYTVGTEATTFTQETMFKLVGGNTGMGGRGMGQKGERPMGDGTETQLKEPRGERTSMGANNQAQGGVTEGGAKTTTEKTTQDTTTASSGVSEVAPSKEAQSGDTPPEGIQRGERPQGMPSGERPEGTPPEGMPSGNEPQTIAEA